MVNKSATITALMKPPPTIHGLKLPHRVVVLSIVLLINGQSLGLIKLEEEYQKIISVM